MLHIDDEKKTESTSVPVSPIIITPSKINDVIKSYTALKHKSWDNSIFPKFISTKMESHECDSIKQLRTFVSSLQIEESTALDQTQLFKLALLLSTALNTNHNIHIEAIAPLVTILGKNRIKAASTLNKMNPKRAVELFDSLCRIPDNRAPVVVVVYAIETDKFKLLPETIELFEKHSDRCEKIYEFKNLTLEERKKKIKSMFEKIYLDEASLLFLLSYTQQFQDKEIEKIATNLFLNQIITVVLKHDEHMIEALYALIWLENHGINTKENEAIIHQRPEDLNYLPQVGFLGKSGKKGDAEFHQKLFNFALEEGAKKTSYSGKLFDPEAKPSIENNVIPLPVLTQPSK